MNQRHHPRQDPEPPPAPPTPERTPPSAPRSPSQAEVRDFRRHIGVEMTPEPHTAWQAQEVAIEALHRASGLIALAGHVSIHEVDRDPVLERLNPALQDVMATAHELIGGAILLLTDDWPDEPEEAQP